MNCQYIPSFKRAYDFAIISRSEKKILSTTGVEYDWETIPIAPSLLRAGTNVVAVEVHQCNATSSDLSFDLELMAVADTTAPYVTETIPVAAATVPELKQIEVFFSLVNITDQNHLVLAIREKVIDCIKLRVKVNFSCIEDFIDWP